MMDYFTDLYMMTEMQKHIHDFFATLAIIFKTRFGLQVYSVSQVIRLIVSMAQALFVNAFIYIFTVKCELFRSPNPECTRGISKSTSSILLPKPRGPLDKRNEFSRCSQPSLLLARFYSRLLFTNSQDGMTERTRFRLQQRHENLHTR